MCTVDLGLCASRNVGPVSQFVYQSIFHDFEPAFAFYRPKKDQCSVCNAFKEAKEKDPLREGHEKHKRAEKQSMDMKEMDKRIASAELGKTFRTITFDMQAILPVSFAGDSQIILQKSSECLQFYNLRWIYTRWLLLRLG
uniref:Uncharacterized protein n=1 Tax=Photinus pyralis TaxID=7054 RepID=A0A1Y1JUE6_PHOPY